MTDVSRKTVLLLLVLVIISSLISTWAFVASLRAPEQVKLVTPKSSVAVAQMGLEIQPSKETMTTGEVALDIVP